MSENTNKYLKSYNDCLNNVNNKYIDIKNEYEKIIISPKGQQIYTNDGASIELDLRKQEALKLQSSITDYTTENNNNLQTNISLKPIEIELSGLIARKVVKAENKNKAQKYLQEKLNPLDNFINQWETSKVQKFLNKAQELQNKVDSYIDKVGVGIGYLQNLTKSINDDIIKTKVYQLYILWKTRTLVNVSCGYFSMDNMAIQNIDFNCGEETTDNIEVNISFKKITFAKTIIQKRQGKTATQRTSKSNNGKTQGQLKSVAFKLVNKE